MTYFISSLFTIIITVIYKLLTDECMISLNEFTSINRKIEYQSSLTLMLLNDWSFITATGIDAKKYLQSQLTTDITKLMPQQHILTAHCNNKGKMLSTLRLFHYNKDFGYILRTSVAEKQLNALKKYAVFSQITLSQQPNIRLLGVAGKGARDELNKYFSQLPNKENPVIHLEQTTLLHFMVPSERFLIVINNETATELIKSFPQHGHSQQWLALDIAAGIANIDIKNSEKFIPQAVNLQALPNSISFHKGCYSGQETVAKAKYRGANKHAMFWLKGIANRLPKIGEAIEWKIGDNWRRTGVVLAAVAIEKGCISIQIVMNNDIPQDSIFRLIESEQNQLTIQPLPYSLAEKNK